jgi:hypothetical protein
MKLSSLFLIAQSAVVHRESFHQQAEVAAFVGEKFVGMVGTHAQI